MNNEYIFFCNLKNIITLLNIFSDNIRLKYSRNWYSGRIYQFEILITKISALMKHAKLEN